MKALFTATLWSALSSVCTIAVGLVRIKILAMLLGPYGIGVLTQLNSYFRLLNTIPNGLTIGIVKCTAQYNAEDHRALGRLFSTVRMTLLVLAVFVTVLSIVFSHKLAEYLLQDESLYLYVIIGSLGLLFTFLASGQRSFIQGMKEIPRLAKMKIIASVLGIILVIPLVYFWKLNGAILHLSLFALITYVVALVIWKGIRRRRLTELQIGGFDRSVIGQVAKYGLVTVVTLAAMSMTYLIVRIYIGNRLGLEQVGVFHAAFGISARYLPIILGSVSIYLLPHLSGIKDHAIISREMNDSLRLFLILLTPMIVVLLGLREVVILVLFTPEFLPAAELLRYQLAGDFFKGIGYAFGAPLIPMGRLKAFLAFDLSWDILFLALSLTLIPVIGLKGVPVAYATARGVFVAIAYIYQRKTMGFRLTRANVRLLIVSSCAVLVVILAPVGLVTYVGLPLLLALWAVISIKRSEVRQVYLLLASRFKNR